MPLTTSQIEEQKRQAEELLGAAEHLGFAKSLFFGHFTAELVFPLPSVYSVLVPAYADPPKPS